MWLDYLKAALRALTSQRFFSFVNLLGLSVGLASVVTISLYVREQLSHDAWLPGHERLFRIDTVETIPDRESLGDRAHAGAAARGAAARLPAGRGSDPRLYRAAQRPARRPDLRRGCDGRRPGLLHACSACPSLSGTPRASARQPRLIASSERAAERYFGRESAVGRRLTLLVPEPREFVVSAVFETIPDAATWPSTSPSRTPAYFRPSSDGSPTIPESWAGSYFHTYARLRDPAGAAIVAAAFPPSPTGTCRPGSPTSCRCRRTNFTISGWCRCATPISTAPRSTAMKPPGSRTTVAALAGVAGLILLIAGINFANLTAARSALRAREVALRKVVGARRRPILAQFLVEAAVADRSRRG